MTKRGVARHQRSGPAHLLRELSDLVLEGRGLAPALPHRPPEPRVVCHELGHQRPDLDQGNAPGWGGGVGVGGSARGERPPTGHRLTGPSRMAALGRGLLECQAEHRQQPPSARATPV